MAAVTLQGLYLAPVADLSDLLAINAGVEISGVDGVRGSYKRYAGGRTRQVREAGRVVAVDVKARRVDRATRERLNSLAGVLCLLRDGRGRKVFGSFLLPKADEKTGLPFADVSFVFTEVSYSEAV